MKSGVYTPVASIKDLTTVDPLVQYDTSLFHWINQGPLTGFATVLDPLMTGLSSTGVWATVACLGIAAALYKKNKALISFFVALTLSISVADLFTYQILKPTFERARPCQTFEDNVRLVPVRCGGPHSFPSNHAANSGSMFGTVVYSVRKKGGLKKYVFLTASFAILVSFSRIYLGVHYPMDVGAGLIVGFVLAGITMVGWDRFLVTRFEQFLDRKGFA